MNCPLLMSVLCVKETDLNRLVVTMNCPLLMSVLCVKETDLNRLVWPILWM